MTGLMEKQVVSKKRVSDHGEVYTRKREVDAMLDLVKQETENIEARFLEPACGTGNFLVEILERKLRVVESRYGKSKLEYERYAVSAASSVYGIDIILGNVEECRQRLYDICDRAYTRLFGGSTKDGCKKAMAYIFSKNIVHGDALTLETVGEKVHPIVFSQWAFVKGSLMKRTDFAFSELVPSEQGEELSLFSDRTLPDVSDLGGTVFIPKSVRDYPVTHFMRIADAD